MHTLFFFARRLSHAFHSHTHQHHGLLLRGGDDLATHFLPFETMRIVRWTEESESPVFWTDLKYLSLESFRIDENPLKVI